MLNCLLDMSMRSSHFVFIGAQISNLFFKYWFWVLFLFKCNECKHILSAMGRKLCLMVPVSLLHFLCLYLMKVRCVVLRADKYFNGRCLFKFWGSSFILIGIHSIFQIPLQKLIFYCFCCSILAILIYQKEAFSFDSCYFTSLQDLNLKVSHFVFVGACEIFQGSSWQVSCVFFLVEIKEDTVFGIKRT